MNLDGYDLGLLQCIILMKYQCTNLDAFSSSVLLRNRNMNSGKWHPSRPPVESGVKAFDENDFWPDL